MNYISNEAYNADMRKRFYLYVWGFLLLLVLPIGGLFLWIYLQGKISLKDLLFDWFFVLAGAWYLYKFRRQHWLKMPDGTYHNLKEEYRAYRSASTEPSHYEATYFYSKKSKLLSFIMGLLVMGWGIWWFSMQLDGYQGITFPIFTIIGSALTAFSGLQGLLRKAAVLKVAKNGLWTQKLHFVNWDRINYAEVVTEGSEHKEQLYLEIRLKGTKSEVADLPDEKLLLTDLQDKEDIELLINQSIWDYNNFK